MRKGSAKSAWQTALVYGKEEVKVHSVKRAVVVLGLALPLTACSWMGGLFDSDTQVPNEPGFYAYKNEQYQRLDGDRDWEIKTWDERSDMDPDLHVVIVHPEIERLDRPMEEAITLQRVAWLRSAISQSGEIGPVDGGRWVVSDVENHKVPLSFVVSSPDLIRALPRQRLQPGLYSLRLRTASGSHGARFGVAWPSVDKKHYSATTCVDRYVGATPAYQQCAAQTRVLATRGLKVYLANTDASRVGDGATLVINGVIVNASDRVQRITTLEAKLSAEDGQILKRWEFSPENGELEPGQSIPFRTVINDPPPEANNIHVRITE